MGLLFKILKYLVVLFLCLLLTLSLEGVSIAFTAKDVAFAPQTYSDLLDKANAYELMQSQMAEMFGKNMQSGGLISQKEMKIALRDSISKQWFDSQKKSLFENFFGYVRGEKSDLVLVVSLEEPKQKIKTFLDSKLSAISNSLPQTGGASISQSLLKQIPASLDILTMLGQIKPQIDQAKQAYSLLSIVSIGLIVLAITLMGLIFLILRSERALLFYFISFSAAAIFAFAIPQAFSKALELAKPNMNAQIYSIAQPIFAILVEKLSNSLNFFAIAYGIISIACIGGFIYLKSKAKKAQTSPPNAATRK